MLKGNGGFVRQPLEGRCEGLSLKVVPRVGGVLRERGLIYKMKNGPPDFRVNY